MDISRLIRKNIFWSKGVAMVLENSKFSYIKKYDSATLLMLIVAFSRQPARFFPVGFIRSPKADVLHA